MRSITNIFKNPITYKVFVDILSLTLFFTFGFIIFETLLPGTISAFISPFTVFLAIFTLLIFIIFLAHKQNISFEKTKNNKILLNTYLIIFCACIALVSFRFGIFFMTISIFFCATIFIGFYKMLQEKFF